MSAGGVVFRRFDDGPRFLLIFDRHRNWGFPKGHLKRKETPLEAARREILEETGLSNLTLHGLLSQLTYTFAKRETQVEKRCDYFLFESEDGSPRPQLDEGITLCGWYAVGDAVDTLTFDTVKPLLEEAVRTVDRSAADD